MKRVLLFASFLSACASAPAAVESAAPALRLSMGGLSEGWQARPIPERLRGHGLLASYVRPERSARIHVWVETMGGTPDDLAESYVVVARRMKESSKRVSAAPPDTAAMSYNHLTRRGEYVIYRLAPDGRVIRFDADFPGKDYDLMVGELERVAKMAF